MYFFLVFGSMIHIFSFGNVSILLIGQFLIGLGLSFGLNSVTQFCAYWFEAKLRNMFYGLLTLSPLLGAAFGPIFPYLLVPFEEDRPFEESKNLVFNYFVYLTIFISFFFVIGAVFLKCFDNVDFKEEDIDNRVSGSRLIDEDSVGKDLFLFLEAKSRVAGC